MLNATKNVSCLVIRTAQQIDTKLMHSFEEFRQSLLVKFYSMKNFYFSDTQAETEKNFSLAFAVVQNIGSLRPCHIEATIRKCLCFQIRRLLGSDT